MLLVVSSRYSTDIVPHSLTMIALYIVRGMMYYRRALMLQSYLEKRPIGGILFCGFFVHINSIGTNQQVVTLILSYINRWRWFSNKFLYHPRIWAVTWGSSPSWFKVYLCGFMPNLWATKAAKDSRGCWYCSFAAKVVLCILFLFNAWYYSMPLSLCACVSVFFCFVV